MNHQYDLSTIPTKVQGIFKRAYSGKSRLAAMKAKCYDCCCFERKEIENCTIQSCPLWSYRPCTSQKTAAKSKEKAEGVHAVGSGDFNSQEGQLEGA